MTAQRAHLVYIISPQNQIDIIHAIATLVDHMVTLPFDITIVDIADQPKAALAAIQRQHPQVNIIMIEAMPPMAWLKRVRILISALRALRPSIVHLFADTIDTSLDLITACWAAQVPWRIATVANVFARSTTDGARPLFALIRGRLLRTLHEFITFTSHAKTILVNEYQLRHDLVRVIPIGIDSQTYALHAIPTRQRIDFQLPTESPLLVAMGPLVHAKGHAVLIHAMDYIWQQIPSAQLLIVGDGPEAQELLIQAQHRLFPGHIHFMGTLSQPHLLLPLIDIFVQPSYSEPMSFHLLLAMALERPVVATSIPNISAIVESNASGMLVRPGDAQALASAIMRIWHDAQLRITVSLNARTRVSQRFELRRWQHDTAACYRVRT